MTEYTNYDMEQMLVGLEDHLDRKDIIGYAAARNARILRNELNEYFTVRDDLVMKYGEADVDENGKLTGSVSLQVDSEKFPDFLDEIGRFSTIKHAPTIFRLKFEEAIGQLSGKELLELEWMFEE